MEDVETAQADGADPKIRLYPYPQPSRRNSPSYPPIFGALGPIRTFADIGSVASMLARKRVIPPFSVDPEQNAVGAPSGATSPSRLMPLLLFGN